MSTYYEDAVLCAYALILFVIVDIVLRSATNWDKNTRYFFLHVLCNTHVAITSLDDLYDTYSAPSTAAFGPCDNAGTAVTLALHLYHIMAFRPLTVVDWVHHIIMLGIILPAAYAVQPGHLMAHGCFYASGFPGGLDYALLVLVKTGRMSPLTEKRYNAYIQTWIRAPGCVIDAFLVWMAAVESRRRATAGLNPYPEQMYLSHDTPEWAIAAVGALTLVGMFWNGMFFQRRVVESYAVHSERAKRDRNASKTK